MPTEIKMPKLGESVVEGTISRWLKRPGEHVELYEPLLEVQTDKVDTEVPAPRAGVVRELAVPEGATVKVGTLIAVLDDAEQPAEQLALDAHQVPAGEEDPQPAEHASPQPSRFISPVVARMAQEHSLDLSQIPGTGLGGRVSKKDVERFLANGRTGEDRRPKAEDQGPPTIDDVRLPVEAAISSPTPQSPSSHTQASSLKPQASSIKTQHSALSPEHSPDSDLLPISAMRRAVAEHMERSVRIAPHVTTVFEADLGRVLAHRDRHRAEFERQAARLTLTPYFVQAVVAGLRAVPVINSTWADEGILQHRRIHIGVAVALEEGLIVPVVRDAD
ncbi:MAG: hypothetical protein RLZZ387_4277, partial [Chloroflexota bacterium]